jgi:hypothetical protein
MILFDLKCHVGHVFEAWFRDGATYEKQRLTGDVSCPICGETKISKAPMAPHIAKTPADSISDETQVGRELVKELERLCRHIEDTAEYVGDKFPDEARRINSGEAETRDIFGEATESEARALAKEGVEVHRISWPRRRRHS